MQEHLLDLGSDLQHAWVCVTDVSDYDQVKESGQQAKIRFENRHTSTLQPQDSHHVSVRFM